MHEYCYWHWNKKNKRNAMNFIWNTHNLFYRICAGVLIFLHFLTFGPVREAVAFNAQSTNYKLSSGMLNQGSNSRASSANKLWLDAIGESCAGKSQSANYILNSGFIPVIQANPPTQTQIIPNQTWNENASKPEAFDMDDYFSSDAGKLTYQASGNTNINVNISSLLNTKLLLHADGAEGSFSFADDAGNVVTNPESYDRYTKLMLHCDGAQGSASFTDSAMSKAVITANTITTTANGVFGGASALFNGTASYLSAADSDDWNFGTGDFSIDSWIRLTSLDATQMIVSQRDDNANFFNFNINNEGGGRYSLRFQARNTTAYVMDAVAFFPSFSLNTWYHVAAVRSGDNLLLYINGSLISTAPFTDTKSIDNFTDSLNIGRRADGVLYFNGNIDELRVSKGIARWAADFTPSSNPYGKVAITATEKKIGVSSALFSGGSYLSLPDSDDWSFGAGDFTIDFWVRFNNTAGLQIISGQYESSNNRWVIYKNASQKLGILATSGGVDIADITMASAWSVSVNTWYHLAFVRNGNTAKIFIDGVSQPLTQTVPFSANINNFMSLLYIGDDGTDYYVNGYLDEFRISKGIARWTADFIPPVVPYAIESDNIVSFSQPQNWHGTEKIKFTASDPEGNSIQSNEVTLLVEGVTNPPVLDYISDISVNEADLVTITPHAIDADGDTITYSFTLPLDNTGKWQTDFTSAGTYTVTVKATDSTGLTDTQTVFINVKNVNRPPVLQAIPAITVNEGDLVTLAPLVSDPDNDAISIYYSSPLDSTGKWLTGYNDAGSYTSIVTASDGTDTVSQTVNITVNNTNRAPQAGLTLGKYTVNPNEEIGISLSASDPDGDAMTYSLNKDGSEISSGVITGVFTTTVSFPNAGDHTITARVSDSGGLITTDSKGVDVVDPNANRDYINPVMGDFNGDALSDLGLHDSQSGKWEICLSDGGVFRNAVDWLTSFGTSKDWWPVGGDFNGDGKTDIGVYNNTNGQLQVAISSGSGFTAQGIWLTVPFSSYSWQAITGNFNGDKYTDFALYNKDTGEVRVYLGSIAGFGAYTTWLNNFGVDYTSMGGDFNGDSLTDLCLFKKSTGEFKIAFSNTKEFIDGTSWFSGFAVDKDPLISDFNNDGLTDIGYWDSSSGRWYYAISTGTAFVNKGLWLDVFGATTDESATTGDFNGDGITDAACFDRDKIGIDRWSTRISTNKPADLLTEIDNGIGGKTQVTYTYASQYENDLLPFPVYVASAISLVDTLPLEQAQETYTQNFTYSGGYFDAVEREFRGFAKVKVTDPITGNCTETYFYQGKPGQDGALKGQIDKILAYDGNGRQISQTLNAYEVRKAGPASNVLGFPALIEQATTVWEENAVSLTTIDDFTYDNIGNLLVLTDNGDVSQTGDEKSSSTIYAQAYENGFNRPLEINLKDKDGNIVSKKNFEYDTKGNLAKEILSIYNPLTGGFSNPVTQYSYDSFGNLTSTINALGNIVTTDYETAYYTYPEKVTNALGQFVTYTYEPKFGAVKSVTDANGAVTTTSYDSLGRVTQVTNALDQITTTYTYPDFNTKTAVNALNLFKTEYIDGLGRKYKTVSQGEDGAVARNVVSEVTYNARGLVDSESLAHYENDDPSQISYARYEYDIRGRLKKTISDFPGTLKDAQSTVNYISPLYAESTDPQGNKKGSRKDVYGNVAEVIEFTQGGVYHTYYEYDIQNNLTKTTDNHGNITQIFYDSLGRKLKMIDPDMGAWLYEYDLLGNLLKQTDAKGQVLTFEYDQLNRLVKKVSLREAAGGEAILAQYSYDDATKTNCIGRLSEVIDQSGSTEFFYDVLGREIKSIKSLRGAIGDEAIPYMVERTYDILDRLATLKYPDGEIVNYSYDANSGLLEKVTGSQNYAQDIIYNAKGQIRTIKYGNDTQTDYTYGQDLRLNRILTQRAASTFQDLNYLFDKNGNVTTLTDNLRSNIRTFTYDDLDRLTQAQNVPAVGGGYTNFDYQYDAIGNMIYKSDVGVMTYGAGAGPHAVTSAGGFSYQYDANGNMIFGKNKTFEYDAENRLISANELGIITTFAYDGDGGRVRKSTPSNTTVYLGSLFEKDSDGTIRKHIFAGANRIATVLLRGSEAAETIYYHSDHLGSSSVITDAAGNQASHYEYTPYGSVAQTEGIDSTQYKFTGKELDNTGLYFYGARYYDPVIGRFITADTIVQAPYDPQSLNRYSYCRNNPINYVDPSGHSWLRDIFTQLSNFIETTINRIEDSINAEIDVNAEVSVSVPFGPGGAPPSSGGTSGYSGYDQGYSSPNHSSPCDQSSSNQSISDSFGNNSFGFLDNSFVFGGLVISQADTPALGPADLIGLGVIAAGLLLGKAQANNIAKSFRFPLTKSSVPLAEIQGYHATNRLFDNFDFSKSKVFSNRFGPALYLSSTVNGAFAEKPFATHLYYYRAEARMLGLGFNKALSSWPISLGIGISARLLGYNAISYQSRRDPMTVNYAVMEGARILEKKQVY